jgi:FAD/FMN-containing dehydrogenase
VSTTLKICAEHNIPFVVSGGKHSVGGLSSITGGLVIDLSKLRNVTINEEEKTLTAEGGCIWKDVDEAAGEKGLAGVGGTINHTGVGGLSCAGGYGYVIFHL